MCAALPDPMTDSAPDSETPRPKARRVPLRARAEYLAFAAAERLVRLLGPDRASDLFAGAWGFFAPRLRRQETALANLERAFPDKTQAEREAIALAMWKNLGRVMAEALLVDEIVGDPSRIVIDQDAPAMAAIRENGGRVVLASLHFANWEIAAWPVTAAGYNTAGVYQRVRNPLVDQRVVALRGTVFPGGMHSKGHGTPRRLLSWVKNGNPIGVLADHRENRGVEVPFFGAPAPSTPLPAFIARSLGVPLIAGRAVRLNGARFRIEGEIVPVPVTEDRNADIEAATASLQAIFERWITQAPEFWMWGHQRWAKPSRKAKRA